MEENGFTMMGPGRPGWLGVWVFGGLGHPPLHIDLGRDLSNTQHDATPSKSRPALQNDRSAAHTFHS